MDTERAGRSMAEAKARDLKGEDSLFVPRNGSLLADCINS
jgi:hypothetical protein